MLQPSHPDELEMWTCSQAALPSPSPAALLAVQQGNVLGKLRN